MSWINRLALIIALLVLCAPACPAEDTLIADDMIINDTANYKTVLVEMGEYKKTASTGASVHYPTSYSVYYEGAKARFIEYNVKRGDEVKKGDLLATLSVDTDEVRVRQLEISLARQKEALANEKARREEELEELRLGALTGEDAYAREIMRLRAQKAALSMELMELTSNRNISSAQKQLNELMETYQNQRVYAPADGIVDDMTYLRDGETVYDGAYLMRVYDPMDIMFVVNDEAGALRYNMPVTISVGANKNRVTGEGRIVASYNALPNAASGNKVFIRATKYDADEVKTLTRPSVSYMSANLSNVLVIDRKALTLFGGKYFVYKLSEDGMVSKRYVTYVTGNAATGAWILDGIRPGDVLILD